MCGRFSQTQNLNQLMTRFLIEDAVLDLKPRYNIAPSQDVSVVISHSGKRSLNLFHWGLIPSWAKERSIGNKMINARAETLKEKPSFKRLIQKKRLLIPADGFYEWQKDATGKTKTPFFIGLKSKELFGFAGLWDAWKSPEGEEVRTFTIITTDANEVLRPIHGRMPVILKKEDEEAWLDPESMLEKVLGFLAPYPEAEMAAYPVSKLVNSPKNDSPECVTPIVKQ